MGKLLQGQNVFLSSAMLSAKEILVENLFALIFVDSELNIEEQVIVDKLAKESFVMSSELEGFLKATYNMFNLLVFE